MFFQSIFFSPSIHSIDDNAEAKVMRVAVITSSIGRKELRDCMESVRKQTHACKHFVYVNGPQWHDAARQTIKDFPEANAFYLTEETGDGGLGPSCSHVFAAAPYLTTAEWIFYLNDDDFFDPNHVESIMKLVDEHNLKWAYSLRKFVDMNGNFICDDDWNSLGHWPCLGEPDQFLVDNSCFAVHRSLATRLGIAWTAMPFYSDRCFLMALKETKEPYGCNGLSTTNYRIGLGSAQGTPETYLQSAECVRKAFPDGFPWREPRVYR